MKSASSVGFLLIVFVALIISAFGLLGRSLFGRKHHFYFVQMADAGGLPEGTKVLMAGVPIGVVQKVTLINPHEARLTLATNEKYQLPKGATALIPGTLVGFGDSTITILSPDSFTGYLPENSTIFGKKGGPLDSIIPDGGKSAVDNITKSLDSVRKLLQDQGLQKELKQLLATADKTLQASQTSLARFNALSDNATHLIASNQGNLHDITTSLKGTLEQVHDTAATLGKFVKDGKLQNGTVGLMTKASTIENQASSLLDKLNKLAGDPEMKKNLQTSAENVKLTTDKGPAIANNVEKITSNMADITDKSKQLPDKINEVADKASKLETSLTQLIDKFNGVKGPSAPSLKDLSYELDLLRDTTPGYWRTDVNLTYPLKTGFITAGIYDAFESNKINLQLGRSFAKSLDFRYGIYGSKAAVGVDYDVTRKLSLRTDLWNINSAEFDARLRYDFGGGVIGWLGVDRAFSHNASPTIGIGIKQ